MAEKMSHQEAGKVVDTAIKRLADEKGVSYPEAVKQFRETPKGAALIEAWKGKRANQQPKPLRTQLETTEAEYKAVDLAKMTKKELRAEMNKRIEAIAELEKISYPKAKKIFDNSIGGKELIAIWKRRK